LAFVPFVRWAESYFDQIYVDLPTANSELFVVDFKPDYGYYQSPFPIAHGCGGVNKYGGEGSVTGYQWGEFVVSRSGAGYDTRALAEHDIASRVQEAAEVLDDSRRAYPKERPVRLVLRYADENGKDGSYFEIVTYDGKTFVNDIGSRDLTTALRFELWQQRQDKR
jgi:hypothetical protein